MRVWPVRGRRFIILIDILALGIGGLLCAAYVAHRPGDALENLWPNLGTELLGVWISIRVIESLLRKSDERSGIRNTLVGNLAYMLRIAQQLLPDLYHFNINDFRHEVKWFAEVRRARERHLSKDEKADIASTFEAAAALLRSVEALSTSDKRAQLAFEQAGFADPLVNAWRDRYNEFRRSWERTDEVHQFVQIARSQLPVGHSPEQVSTLLSLLDAIDVPATEAFRVRSDVSAFEAAANKARTNVLEEQLAQ